MLNKKKLLLLIASFGAVTFLFMAPTAMAVCGPEPEDGFVEGPYYNLCNCGTELDKWNFVIGESPKAYSASYNKLCFPDGDLAFLPTPSVQNCSTYFDPVVEGSGDFPNYACQSTVCKFNKAMIGGNDFEDCLEGLNWTTDYMINAEPQKLEYDSAYTLKISLDNPEDGSFSCVSCDGATVEDVTENKSTTGKAVLETPKDWSVGKHTVTIKANRLVGGYSLEMERSIVFNVKLSCAQICAADDSDAKCKQKCEATGDCKYEDKVCKDNAGIADDSAGAATKTSAEWDAYFENLYPVPEGYVGALPPCAFHGTCRSVNDLLQLIVNFGAGMFAILGSFAFAFFVYGGFMIVISMGNAEKVKKGTQIMIAAVVGLAFALGAYILVDLLLDALQVSPEFRGIK